MKNTSKGKFSNISKLLVKVIIVVFVLSLVVILLDKIHFPGPNKKIEKIIPNENFKAIK